ncbi:MAG: DUF1697 domain-containing protein [Chitinophagales bacterium]
MKSKKEQYVAFLRGINVGGHHKVPMADLRKEMENLKFEKVVTLLNSGNIVFDAIAGDLERLEKTLSEHLEKTFGFPIPTIVRKAETIDELLKDNPFKDIILTKDIRLYVSFLQTDTETDLELPWESEDKSFKIISVSDKTIVSVLDLSISKTPKAMDALEKYFGKDITTRNWNTIKRIEKKLEDSR